MKVFIVDSENFSYDFLIGLDCIKNFKLTQTEDLRIIQEKSFQKQENKLSINVNAKKKTNVNTPALSGDKKEKINNSENLETKSINSETENIIETNNSDYLEYTKKKHEVNFNEHINTDEFEMIVNHLDVYKQSEIDKLLNKYKSVFAKDKYDVGTVKEYEAHIDLMEEKYCYKRPYRCTFEDRREIENQVAKLLEKGLIEESYSPFAAPVTLAFKKDEKKNQECV